MKHIIILAALILMTSACGVKPSTVDAPHGNAHDPYPHTYPSE